MVIKALIVDDEPLARQIIREYAKKIPALSIISECQDTLEASEFLYSNDIDLIFLDINMPKLSGIEFLKSKSQLPYVILTTAYSEYALEGYELSVIDYLKKPFSFERFCKALFKVEELLALKKNNQASALNPEVPDFIFIKTDKKTTKIKISDILYIEGLGDYIKIHTNNQKFVSNLSMKKILEHLPNDKFYRIHKSFIISLSKIESIEGNLVKIGNTKIPVGLSYKPEFFQFIQNFIAE